MYTSIIYSQPCYRNIMGCTLVYTLPFGMIYTIDLPLDFLIDARISPMMDSPHIGGMSKCTSSMIHSLFP